MSTHSTPRSMAFYHTAGLVPAWEQASTFAGEQGRIGTLPDVLRARIGQPEGVATNSYFTTLTSEFCGLSRAGVPVIAVLHGKGPLASIDGITKAYAYSFKDKTRNRRGGRVDRKTFLDILDGKFSDDEDDTHVIDLESYKSCRKYTFSKSLLPEEAMTDPLARARMGSQHAAYIELMGRMSTQERRGRHDLYHPEYVRNLHPAGRILRLSDSSDFSYVHESFEDDLAFASLLSVSQAMRTGEANDLLDSLQTEISPHSWHDGVRLLGIRPEGLGSTLEEGVNKGFSLDRAMNTPAGRELLFTACEGLAEETSGMFSLCHSRLGDGTYFTQHPKVGESLDTGEPEYEVTSLEPVGEPVKLTLECTGYYALFRYPNQSVKALAPTGSNAFRLLTSSISVSDCGKFQTAYFQFMKVVVNCSRRIPRKKIIENNIPLVIELASMTG